MAVSRTRRTPDHLLILRQQHLHIESLLHRLFRQTARAQQHRMIARHVDDRRLKAEARVAAVDDERDDAADLLPYSFGVGRAWTAADVGARRGDRQAGFFYQSERRGGIRHTHRRRRKSAARAHGDDLFRRQHYRERPRPESFHEKTGAPVYLYERLRHLDR